MTPASITDPMRLAGLLPSLIPTSASLLAVSRAGRTEHQRGSTSPDCAATHGADLSIRDARRYRMDRTSGNEHDQSLGNACDREVAPNL